MSAVVISTAELQLDASVNKDHMLICKYTSMEEVCVFKHSIK